MLISDPISDMIIRIKNAFLAGHDVVVMPASKMKLRIADILKKHDYIEDFEVIEKKPQSELKIVLKYRAGKSVINDVKRLSKPGRRIYCSAKTIPQSLNGFGITIISTNKGVMTDKQARSMNVGGEILCQVW